MTKREEALVSSLIDANKLKGTYKQFVTIPTKVWNKILEALEQYKEGE